MAKRAFNNLEKTEFNKLLDINQLIVTKDYFLKNLKLFKSLFFGKTEDILTEENTIFVSIPLLRLKKKIKTDYSILAKSSRMKFLDKLCVIFFQRSISLYPFKLVIAIIFGKKFIFKHLKNEIFTDFSWHKLKILKEKK